MKNSIEDQEFDPELCDIESEDQDPIGYSLEDLYWPDEDDDPDWVWDTPNEV